MDVTTKLLALMFAASSLPTDSVVIPSKEFDELRKGDPVLDFVEKVNTVAVAKDYWHTDFRRAHYDAFVEEANRYVLEKYRKTHKP